MLACTSSKNKPKARQRKSNKNKKKNWRKNIDVSAIEDALDVERLEMRTGGIVSEKKNEELFFIDKSASEDHESKLKRLRKKRLRIDEIIVPYPTNVKAARKTSKKVKKQVDGALQAKLKRKQMHKPCLDDTTQDVPYDIWSEPSLHLYDKVEKKTPVMKYTEQIVGKRHIRRPEHLKRMPNDVEGYRYRNVPAVEPAHPGASYNPTFDDHQELLSKAHQVEVNKLKSKERIDKALHVPYSQLPDQGNHEREMQEGLFQDETVLAEEPEEDTNETLVANAPVRAENRKTRRKRRMEEKAKMEREQREKAWGEKLRENEVFRTKTFLAEIHRKEKKNAARRELRRKKLRMPILSNVKFTEQDIELKLSDELKGSLRELKPEAGLLTDRYKSLQKRGIVEPRCKRRVPKRKYKIKYQEKRAWREIE